jgi:RNA polymerase sigma-70 factor (ECF subfamily)
LSVLLCSRCRRRATSFHVTPSHPPNYGPRERDVRVGSQAIAGEGTRVTARAARATEPEAGRRPLALVRDHTDRLFQAAYALCGTRAGAEEVVEETLARTLERRRVRRRGRELAYLMRVLRDTWVDFGRSAFAGQAATSARDLEWIVDESGGAGEVAHDVRLAYAAVTELPPPLREAVVAVDVVGLSHRGAARALRIAQGTLISRVVRGHERIAAALEGACARADDEQDEPAAAGHAVRRRDPSDSPPAWRRQQER